MSVQFDESATRHSTSKTSDGSVLTGLLRAAQAAGLDPVAELYNEALKLANEGHYGQARARLQVLLGLAPSDGDAHLLLARVLVSGQQWKRAIASLDDAAQCGTHVPEDLRDRVLRHLHQDLEEGEDERATRMVREQGELKKLRSEVRRLRSEHAHVAATLREREKEAARWMWIATGTSLVAIAFIGYLSVVAVLRGPEAPPDAELTAEAQAEPAAPAAAGSAQVVRDPDEQARVADALAEAGLSDLRAIVRGTRASLSGTVPTHAARKQAAELVAGLPGIESVDVEAVVNVAARDGATYVVRSGDSLSLIAVRMYGDASKVDEILKANPALGGRPDLKIDQELVIPALR